jgi:malonate transporter and related proteins
VNYAQLLFPDFCLIVVGYLLCRFTELKRNVWEQVDSLVYYFLFPVLLFHSIVRSPINFGAMSNLITAAVCLVSCGILITYGLGFWSKIHKDDFAASAQIAFRFNSFIGLAVAERIAGREGILMLAVLIGVCVPICNIGAVWPMAKNSGVGVIKALTRNPLVIATAGGLLANVVGFAIPTWAELTVTRIGQASIALGLLAAGAGMQMGQIFNSVSKRYMSVCVLIIRHLVMPLIALAMIRIFHLNPAQATMLLIYSALPTAGSCYVLAAKMGYDGAFVAGLVTVSTILGALSLPFALELIR